MSELRASGQNKSTARPAAKYAIPQIPTDFVLRPRELQEPSPLDGSRVGLVTQRSTALTSRQAVRHGKIGAGARVDLYMNRRQALGQLARGNSMSGEYAKRDVKSFTTRSRFHA